jgi:hypothetical protein
MPLAGAGAEALDLLPDAVIVLEAGPVVAFLNRAAESLFGISRADVVGRPCTVLRIKDAEGRSVCERAPLGKRLPLVKGLPERDFEVTRSTGEYVPVAMRCAYLKDAAGVVRRVVCSLRDARPRRGMDMRTVEVISTVSHEIRSPLTSIKGFTKTLLDRWDRFDDDMKREMLGAVNNDADRVTRLLGELLDISRLEAGRLKLRLQPLDVAALAERVVDRMRERADAHDLVFNAAEVQRVPADPDKVEQVLTNLIENAIKYTEAGTVTVSVTENAHWVCAAVSDQGEGIPEAQLTRLFRKFYRRERAGSPSGTGLGLYICKGLVEAHGGDITVRSTLGEGTTFEFRLPAGDTA